MGKRETTTSANPELPAEDVMSNKKDDQIFLQNSIVILIMMAGIICIFIIIARVVGNNDESIAKQRALVLMEETRPVSQVRMASGDAAPAVGGAVAEAEAAHPGKQTYDSLCSSCHGTGLPNVPQLGNADHWTDRLAQGIDTVYGHAINGFTGSAGMPMPARGGNPSLSDDEVKAAVDYIIENSVPAETTQSEAEAG